VDGLGSAAPLGERLPAVFADDDLAQRFVGGLDDVLAPILNVLECLDSYFTPSLAPLDFTRYVGSWVGAEIEGAEEDALLRAAVAAAASLHRIRGTRRGLSEAVRLVFGVEPEITESGAAEWHARPLGAVPGMREPGLRVVLRLPDPTPADRHRLDTLVAAARPAHIPYAVHIVAAKTAKRSPR
jgi:phage tail-like protein